MKVLIYALFAGIILSGYLFAQTDRPCKVEVIAGPPSTSGGDGGPATSAYLLQPTGVAVSSQGVLLIADTQNHRIRAVQADGTINTVAGTGTAGNAGDGGSALAAQLSAPRGVVAGPDGSVYIADTGNHRIRLVTLDGTMVAFAGGHSGFSGDNGPALSAELSMPTGLAVGSDGSVYIADTGNNRIRRVDPSGTITTVAGSQNGVPVGHGAPDPCCYGGDGGLATTARLNSPRGVAVGSDGTIYIADTINAVIRKVDGRGTITTLAGAPTNPVANYPQSAAKAFIGNATSVAIGANGSLIIGSTNILQLTPDGIINLFESPFVLSGFGASNFNVTTDGNGVVYASDPPLNVVWRVLAPGQKKVLAGQFYFALGVEGGPAIGPNLHGPQGMAVGIDGSVYVADSLNHRVRRILPDGTIQTIAGTGVAGESGDGGPAASAQLNFPGGVSLDASGTIYIADTNNHAIRKLSGDGTMRTIAGPTTLPGVRPLGGSPRGLVVEANGDIVVWVDYSNAPPQVIKLTSNPVQQFINVGALTSSPTYGGISLDSHGNYLIAVGPSVVAIAPVGSGSYYNTGPIVALSITPAGDLFFAQSSGRIKKMEGSESAAFFNRGLLEFLGSPEPAIRSSVALTNPTSLASDPQGSLYIADRDLHRIRKLLTGSCQVAVGPVPSQAVNSATLAASSEALSPGELVTIFGTGLGPSEGVGPALDPGTGLVPTTLGGVRVTFDGIAAPILYASDKQINVIVPFTIYGRAQSKVTVERDGVPSDSSLMPLADTFPRVFASGGQSIVVNSDGTLNSATNPAKGGSYVTFYMSGLGRTNPPGLDGHLAVFPLPAPLLPLTTDDPFEILYAGSAPGLVEGFIQVNMQLPTNPLGGLHRVALHSGSSDTTVGLYIR